MFLLRAAQNQLRRCCFVAYGEGFRVNHFFACTFLPVDQNHSKNVSGQDDKQTNTFVDNCRKHNYLYCLIKSSLNM